MSFYSWKPYISAAERRAKAEKAAAKATRKGKSLSPMAATRGAIAKTFWGKAWCENLERYSDFSNRLPRGRTYLRNGSVIDLQVAAGQVRAQVMGSRLYSVAVQIIDLSSKQWQSIGADCAGSIDSMVELLQGRLSKGVMERICKPGTGLLPTPKEITFECSCPDWATMCKHVAAVLYGVGVRLDEQPELIFILRGVDPKDLVKQAGSGIAKSAKRRGAGKVLDDAVLSDLFGIEIVDVGQAERAHRSGNKEGSNVTSGRPAKRVAATAAKQAVPRNPEGTKNTADTKTGQREKAATKTPVMLSKVMTVKAGAGRSAEPKAKPATGKPVPVGVSKRKAR